MPSPSAASENVVASGQSPRRTVTVPVCLIKRSHRRLDTCLIQCVSHAAVHWSERTVVRQMRPYMQRVGGRPTARPL